DKVRQEPRGGRLKIRRRTRIDPTLALVNSTERKSARPQPRRPRIALKRVLRKTILVDGIGDDEPLPNVDIHQGIVGSVSRAVCERIHHAVEKYITSRITGWIIGIRNGWVGERKGRAVCLQRT